MSKSDPLEDLDLLLRSRYALVVIDTPEEDRVNSLLMHLADRRSLPLFTWTPTKGLRRQGMPSAVYGTTDPIAALDHVESSRLAAVYQFEGLQPFLTEPLIVGKLKDAASQLVDREGAIILTGAGTKLPEPMRALGTRLSMPPPDLDEYRDLLLHILRDLKTRDRIQVEITTDERNRLLQNLRGLTLLEAEKILTRSIVEDGRLGADDLRKVVEAKKEIVEREGLLEYYPVEETMAGVADLASLKSWLAKRQKIVSEPERAAEFGLEFPKGVLLLGVPGCGKSLCAKAVAMEWGLPLLKLDPSNLYNKYIGESERNFKRAMETAERMSPVVLWIDELEKAFSGSGDSDDGVSMRILGSFLSWMQDRRGDVFVVATANDVQRLPAEFLRKGRFDEIFFVDLPDAETRARIFEIHLEKRGHDPARFETERLAEAAEGFSGSEVEGAVVAALYTAFSDAGALGTEDLLREIGATRPLSVLMGEKVAALRAWAEGRTVRAN